MEIRREMWIGAGALAFVGSIVLMLPPTTPVAPPATSVRPHARATATPPADAPAFSTVSAIPPSPIPSTPSAVPPAVEPAPELAMRNDEPSPQWRDSVSPDDEGQPIPDPDFSMGYRWAEENGIFERRDCRRWRGSPAEDGCRAYLRDTGDEEG